MHAQVEQEVSIKVSRGLFVVGFDNWLQIEDSSGKPVPKEAVSILLQPSSTKTTQKLEIVEEEGAFLVQVDRVGKVIIEVQTKKGLQSTSFPAQALTAVAKISKYKANTEQKIKAAELKAQSGVIANIEHYNIYGTCTIDSYQVLQMANGRVVRRAYNVGGKFQAATRAIVRTAASGDVFIFKQIRYRCPGHEEAQKLEDIILEVE